MGHVQHTQSRGTSPGPPVAFGVALALAAAVLLSINNATQALFYAAGGSAEAMLLIRFATFAVVGMAIVSARLERPLWPTATEARKLLFSALTFTVGTTALLLAMQRVSVSLAILLLYTFPLFTTLLQGILDRRWPPALVVVASAVAFAGLVVALEVTAPGQAIVGEVDATTGHLDFLGVGLAVAAGFLYAVTFEWNVRQLPGLQAVYTTTWMTGFGLPVVIAIVVLGPGDVQIPTEPWPLAAGVVSVGAFIAGMVTVFRGVADAGPLRAGVVLNLEPILTIALTAAVLGEALRAPQIIGAGLVMAGVVMAQWAGSRRYD